jgi:hypothetical protein
MAPAPPARSAAGNHQGRIAMPWRVVERRIGRAGGIKQRGLALQGAEVVDVGSYGDRSHALSIRLSPVTIKASADPTMTLEKFWQTKKCLAVWEDEPSS